MAEEQKDELDEKTLAALCYVPIMMVNWIAILYVLIVKKSMKFARFHAIQSAATYFGLWFVGGAAALIGMVCIYASFILGIFTIAATSNPTSIFSFFGVMWSGGIMVWMLAAFFSIAILVYFLYLAYLVYSGKDPRVPIIGKRIKGLD